MWISMKFAVVLLWVEINNSLLLIFHLPFMFLALHPSKSYTHVLKHLQIFQAPPIPYFEVKPCDCFLLREKNKERKENVFLFKHKVFPAMQKTTTTEYCHKIFPPVSFQSAILCLILPDVQMLIMMWNNHSSCAVTIMKTSGTKVCWLPFQFWSC